MCKHKAIFLFFIFSINLYAIEVIVTTKKINYNETINIGDLKKTQVIEIKKICEPVKAEDLKNKKYIATHYMKKNHILCKDDLKEYKKNSVLFNFGAIQIEREGKVIFENEEYIKIKKNDGKIEKIYKDGRVQ